MFDTKRQLNENECQYIWRLGQAKDSGLLDVDWNTIATLINKEFRADETEYRTEAAYRKGYQQAKKYYENNVFNDISEDKHYKEMQLMKQSLEKEKVKVRDERNELKRLQREEARRESYREQFLRSIIEHQGSPLEYDKNAKFSGILKTDNDLLVSLFDIHAGIEIDNFFNTYNQDVLRERLNKYLDKIFEVQLRHGSENVFLVVSEAVSGFIHPTLRIENNQDMIDQFLTVSEYLAHFIQALSYRFNKVYIYVVPGNHGRLSPKKEENLTHENMDCLILPFLEAKLQNFTNIFFGKNTVEDTIAMFVIRNTKVFSSHGDKEAPQDAIQRLTLFTGIRPDIYLCGHRHTNAMSTIYDSKVLQAGSVSGADSYCMDKRLRNRPEQLIAVVDESGLDCIYDVKFH